MDMENVLRQNPSSLFPSLHDTISLSEGLAQLLLQCLSTKFQLSCSLFYSVKKGCDVVIFSFWPE